MTERSEQDIMKRWRGDISIPVVSVCTITYNHEKFIVEAIDSFLMQETDFPFEIVMDDDCSPDNTAAIIRKYADKYPNIIKANLREENVGMMSNFIGNLKRAKGKYIALCEGDDYWTDPLKLQKQVDFLETDDELSGVHHKVMYIDKNGSSLGESNRVDKGFEVIDYKYVTQRNTIRTCSFVFKRNIIDQSFLDIANIASAGDRVLFIKASLVGKIAYIDKTMAAYRRNVGISYAWGRVKTYQNFIDTCDIFEKNKEFPEINIITNLAKRYYYYKLATAYSEEHKYYKSFKAYISLLYYTVFVLTTKEQVVFKVPFKQYIKTGLFTIPYTRELMEALHVVKKQK